MNLDLRKLLQEKINQLAGYVQQAPQNVGNAIQQATPQIQQQAQRAGDYFNQLKPKANITIPSVKAPNPLTYGFTTFDTPKINFNPIANAQQSVQRTQQLNQALSTNPRLQTPSQQQFIAQNAAAFMLPSFTIGKGLSPVAQKLQSVTNDRQFRTYLGAIGQKIKSGRANLGVEGEWLQSLGENLFGKNATVGMTTKQLYNAIDSAFEQAMKKPTMEFGVGLGVKNIRKGANAVNQTIPKDFGSISPTSNGKFVAYDTIRNERIYEKGKGATAKLFSTEADAQKAIADRVSFYQKNGADVNPNTGTKIGTLLPQERPLSRADVPTGPIVSRPNVANQTINDTGIIRKPIHDATEELFNVYANIDKNPGTLPADQLKASLEKLRKITNNDEIFFGYAPEAEYAIGSKAKDFLNEVGDKQFRFNMIDALEHFRTTLHKASEAPELAMQLGVRTPEEFQRLEQMFSDALANQNAAPGKVLSRVAPKVQDILEGKTTVNSLVGDQNLVIGRETYDVQTIKNRLDRTDYANLLKKFSKPTQTINDVGAKASERSTLKLNQPLAKIQSAAKGIQTEAKTLLDESATKAEQLSQRTQQEIAPLENVIQQSGLDVKKKVNILDLARTPDRILEKVGLGNEMTAIRKADEAYRKELPQQIEKITQWSKQVPAESNQRIFQYLDGKPVDLQPNELEIAGEIKNYLKSWAERLGLPEDKRISNYITHIFPEGFIQKEFDSDLAKIIDQNVAGSVYDPFTQQRLGKLGYREDTWAALDAYVKRATRKVNMDPALEQVSKAAKELDLESYKYVKNYVDRINLRPLEIENLADNLIKSTPIGYSLGQRPTTALTQKARQMIYRGTLGLNVGSAIKNLTQGVNTYAKLGEKYTLIGYAKLFKNFRSNELKDVGVLTNDLIQDRTISSTKKFMETVDKGLFSLFELAEKINRGSAYYGAKSKALAEGLDEQAAIDFAKKIVRDTQFTFGSIDTPPILQSDIGKTLLQFQSFNIKQAEFLGEMVAAKDVAGLLRWTLASLAVVSTVGKALGMKPQDLIPSVRVGGSPLFTLANDIGGVITQGRDQYGNVPSMGSRLKKIGNDVIPFIPGGVQLKKISKGSLVSSVKPSIPQVPTPSPIALTDQITTLTPVQKAKIDVQIKSLTAQQKQILLNVGWNVPFVGQVGGLTEQQRNEQFLAMQDQINTLKQLGKVTKTTVPKTTIPKTTTSKVTTTKKATIKKGAKVTIKKVSIAKIKSTPLKAGKITIAKPPAIKKIAVGTTAKIINPKFKVAKATVKMQKIKYA